jgi:hypothetical protein
MKFFDVKVQSVRTTTTSLQSVFAAREDTAYPMKTEAVSSGLLVSALLQCSKRLS